MQRYFTLKDPHDIFGDAMIMYVNKIVEQTSESIKTHYYTRNISYLIKDILKSIYFGYVDLNSVFFSLCTFSPSIF